MASEWLQNVIVNPSLDNHGWYVCYTDKTHRLRLTNRGTWSRDDMDIYWPTQAKALAALQVAPCPLDDPYARIKELEEECRKSSKILMRQYDKMTLAQVQELPWLSAAITIVAQDLGAVVANEGSKE